MFEKAVSGWHKVSLTDLAAYINGYAFKPEDWSEHGLPIVRIAQITGSSAECDYFRGSLSDDYRVDNGDIIFSWSGTLCVVRWSGGPGWLNQHLFKVKPVEGVNERLLYHLLSHAVEEMNKSAHGSTMKHIKRGELKRYQLLFPLREDEQAKLAGILDTLDTQIQQTEALIAKLEKVKEGLLHDLLTRGIDESGQLRPSPEQAPELYKDSPLGLIPKHWELASFHDIAQFIGSGVTPRGGSESYEESGVPFLRSQNVHFDGLRLEGVAYIAPTTHQEMSRNHTFPLDVLLNITGASIGRCCMVPKNLESANVNQHVCIIRLGPEAGFSPELLWMFLSSSFGQNQIERFLAGGSREGLNYRHVKSLMISIPSMLETKKIIEAFLSKAEIIRKEREALSKLAQSKSGLMDDLLTGRVRVTPLLEQEASATTA